MTSRPNHLPPLNGNKGPGFLKKKKKDTFKNTGSVLKSQYTPCVFEGIP